MFGQAERVLELERLSNTKNSEKSSRIIAFTSGKGGTGKTFVSLNIAFALSKENKKILFVDLDPNLSNANILLNVVATKTIYNFFTGRNLLTEQITEYEPNLHFIFGDSGKLDYPKTKPELLKNFFYQLRFIQNKYDIIILDTGSGASEDEIGILLNADHNIIITTPEPTAVMDAYVIIKLLTSRKSTASKMLIINKCNDKKESVETFNNLSMAAKHFLKEKLNLLGEIDYDPAVGRSILTQELFYKKYSRSSVGIQISKISKSLYEIVQMVNNNQSTK